MASTPVITNIEDLRHLAKRLVPRMFYDYADSGSWTESTYRANEADFQRIKLRQRVAVDIVADERAGETACNRGARLIDFGDRPICWIGQGRRVVGAGEARGDVEAVDVRELHVEQHHLRAQPARLGDRLRAVGGLAHDVEPLGFEEYARRSAKRRVVVDDEDPRTHGDSVIAV